VNVLSPSTNDTAFGIDWSRMAYPQEDGVDTAMLLRQTPRRPRRSETTDASTLCDGRVAVRPAPAQGVMSRRFRAAPVEHPNLSTAVSYLSRWPAAYDQFTRLVDTVYPYTDSAQADQGEWSLGGSSYSHEEDLASVHVTVDNALGLAQALVKEMAHQKLRALGVSARRTGRLVINDGGDMYAGPICRAGQRQPMSAVFHDQYAFMHVTALDLHMLTAASHEVERQHLLMLLARNIPRVDAGHAVIVEHVETDTAGRAFVDAFLSWSRTVLDQGQAQLDANGYGGL
jgi:HEXXH motif-containing protein